MHTSLVSLVFILSRFQLYRASMLWWLASLHYVYYGQLPEGGEAWERERRWEREREREREMERERERGREGEGEREGEGGREGDIDEFVL